VKRLVLPLVPIVLGAACAATGVVVVAPGEAAVVRRCGRLLPRPWGPGPHLAWPFGLDRVTRIQTDRVRRIEVGLAETAESDQGPGVGEFLTGDRNLIRARAIVHYRVADPMALVRQGPAVEAILSRGAEAALGRALAARPVDEAIGTGRLAMARDVATALACDSQALGLGVAVLGVSLTDARPPVEVEPDFAAAQAARSERERRLNEAKTEAARTRLAAEAQASTTTSRAQAEAARLREQSHARAERFLSLLAESRRSRRLTVRRLYLDTLRDLLPKVRRKVLLTPDEPVDLSIFGTAASPER
jgi:membrane protease subunit HflK